MDIERTNNRTEVIVDEGINTVSYALDEQLIEALTLIQVRALQGLACKCLHVLRVCVHMSGWTGAAQERFSAL